LNIEYSLVVAPKNIQYSMLNIPGVSALKGGASGQYFDSEFKQST